LAKDFVFILLFLLPGVIAVIISDIIIGSSGQKKSDLEKTVEGIFLSIPCLILTWLLIQLSNKIWIYCGGFWWDTNSIEQFKLWLDSIRHLILYFSLSLMSAFLIGCLFATRGKPKSTSLKAVNILREKYGKANLSGYSSVWDEITDDLNAQVVEIRTKDGFIKKGFIKSSSPNTDKYREITLEGFDEIRKYQGYFEDETLVFLNLDSGTVITLYDMTLFNQELNKVKQQMAEAG